MRKFLIAIMLACFSVAALPTATAHANRTNGPQPLAKNHHKHHHHHHMPA